MRPKQAVALLAVALGLSTFGQAEDSLTNGLVGYFRFDGNANDESGNGNHGIVRGAQPATDRFGIPNRCYQFDRIRQDGIAATGRGLPVGKSPRSLSVWFKVAATETNDMRVLGYGPIPPQAPGSDFNLAMSPFREATQNQAVTIDFTYNWNTGFPSQSLRGAWHHLVATVDGQNMKLFIDGESVTVTHGESSPVHDYFTGNTDQPGSLRFGYFYGAGEWDYYGGYLDDVRIYNRALSDQEVQALYAYEAAPFSDGLIAYYPFNGTGEDATGANPMVLSNIVFGTDRFGEAGKALWFDGIQNTMAQSERIVAPTVADSFTMTIWAQAGQKYDPHGYASVGNVLIQPIHGSVNYGDGHAGVGLMMGNDGVGIIAHSDNYDPMPVEYHTNLSGWHQIALTYNQKRPSLYVDGRLVGDAQPDNTYVFHPSSGDPNIPDEFWIPIYGGIGFWAQWNNPGQLWDYSRFAGSADDFRIYNRALSDQEIRDLYVYEAPERPWLTMLVKTVQVTLHVKPTKQYQLEASLDFKTWAKLGDPFVAATSEVVQEFNAIEVGRYFRLTEVP